MILSENKANHFEFFFNRAVNARTKAHAAEVSAKQARADSEYARIRAHEVAPDFAQPGSRILS